MASNFHVPPLTNIFKDTEHASRMVKQIYSCLNNEKYCDVTLQIDQNSIKSHKVVLASLSDYFRGLFDMTDTEDKSQSSSEDGGEIHVLKDVHYASFQLLLKFAYTGEVDITAENAQDLLICANYFGVIAVKNACEEFMLTNTDSGNCIDLINFAHAFSLLRLESHSFDYIGECFESVMATEEFLSIPLETFIKLCLKKDLVILRRRIPLPAKSQELSLLKAALRYTRNSPETDREKILSELLKVIRLPLIGESSLIGEFDNYQDLLSLPSVKSLIDLSINSGSFASDNSDIPSFWNSNRMFSRQHTVASRRRLACNNQVGEPETEFDDAENIEYDDHIQQIILWIRKWDGRPVLSGLQIRYNSGTQFTYGGKASITRLFVGEHTVNLEEDEVITKVTGACGWLVDRLTFHTNLGRILGPFGGQGGGEFTESAKTANDSRRTCWSDDEDQDSLSGSDEEKDFRPHFNLTPDFNFGNLTPSKKKNEDGVIDGYLHAFVGAEVTTQSDIAITHLGFVWMKFETVTPTSENTLPVSAPVAQKSKVSKSRLKSYKFFGKRRGAR